MNRLYLWISSILVLIIGLFSSQTEAKSTKHHVVKHKHHHKRHKAHHRHVKRHHRHLHHKHVNAHRKHVRHHQRHHKTNHKRFMQIGEASYYGYHDGFAGKRTADGSIFNPMQATVAHRTLPLGSVVKITNLETGRSQVARVTDRGPFYGNRIVDVSYGIAKRLGMIQDGTCKVRIEKVI